MREKSKMWGGLEKTGLDMALDSVEMFTFVKI